MKARYRIVKIFHHSQQGEAVYHYVPQKLTFLFWRNLCWIRYSDREGALRTVEEDKSNSLVRASVAKIIVEEIE